MLRRNGELCEHSVPGFAGRLTKSELQAYNTVWPLVQDRMEQFIVPSAAGDIDQNIILSDLLAQIRGILGERFPGKEQRLDQVANALAQRTMQAVLPSLPEDGVVKEPRHSYGERPSL